MASGTESPRAIGKKIWHFIEHPLALTGAAVVLALIGTKGTFAFAWILLTIAAIRTGFFEHARPQWRVFGNILLSVGLAVGLSAIWAIWFREPDKPAISTYAQSVLNPVGVYVASLPWRWILMGAAIGAACGEVFTKRWIRRHPERLQITTENPCAYEWVHKIADDDLANIGSLVRVVGVYYQPVFDKAYIDFTFSVFNISLYDIVIKNVVKDGSIRFGEDWEKFHYRRLHIESDVPIYCEARNGAWFVIRQAVRPEERDRFKANDYLITFSDLVIEFEGANDSSSVKTTQLDLSQLYLETKKGVLRRLDHLDIIFMYSDEQWAALKNEEELNALRKQTKVLQEGMKDRKVIFQVDDVQSQVHVTRNASAGRIQAKIRLRCEKAISAAVAIKEFHAALCQETSNGDSVIIEREHAQVVWAEPKMNVISMENGWTITEPLTPYRWFNFFLDIPSDVEAKLDRDHFIRVSMLVVGQESRAADFHVDSWSDARHSNSSISIR